MTSFVKRTWAEINLDIAAENYKLICEKALNLPVVAVIKADAYGHGATEMAHLYENMGVKLLAVSGVDEGIELRNSGIKTPILIFGYTPVDDVIKLSKYDMIQTIYSAQYARIMSAAAVQANITIKIHIKLDTGMGRLGFDCCGDEMVPSGAAAALEAANLRGFSVSGIYTHFSAADSTETSDKDFTEKQYQRFSDAVTFLKENGVNTGFVHCSNSAALLTHEGKGLDGVRAGIILYGLAPSGDVAVPSGIKSVMQFKSTVTMVKTASVGDTFSYGRTYTAKGDMRVATVCVGYADGYPRAASGKGRVIIHGKYCKILGRVCMDQIIVDVTVLDDVEIGDEVILIGHDADHEITADEVAGYMSSINYEVVCDIGTRVPRVYIKNGEIVKVINRIIQ